MAQRQSARTMAARGRALAFPMSCAIWVPRRYPSMSDKEGIEPTAGTVTPRRESVAKFWAE